MNRQTTQLLEQTKQRCRELEAVRDDLRNERDVYKEDYESCTIPMPDEMTTTYERLRAERDILKTELKVFIAVARDAYAECYKDAKERLGVLVAERNAYKDRCEEYAQYSHELVIEEVEQRHPLPGEV